MTKSTDLPYTFFVTKLQGKELVVEVLRTDAKLQETLTRLFRSQRKQLLGDAKPIRYVPGEEGDEHDVFVIPGFEMPSNIENAIREHDILSVLKRKGLQSAIRSIFAVASDGEIMFQRFWSRQLLVGKLRITLSSDTFSEQKEAGLLIGEKVEAVVTSKGVFFRSFTAAKAVLPNLADYFSEATDRQVMEFANHPLLRVADPSKLVSLATSWHRKRIAAIQYEGILDKVSASQIKLCANQYGLALDIKKDPNTGKQQILLPDEPKQLRLAIKLLSNELLQSELTEERFSVPAKRKITTR